MRIGTMIGPGSWGELDRTIKAAEDAKAKQDARRRELEEMGFTPVKEV